ncbi:MAG: [FeFe] hydrogenase H-cluster radical SAM maturase HydE [Sporomusaceae bacterium]|nr:[FeFe] hydrogenase H-cluster radical SAM maturase HydE [Sporomusaceae bacterium]
MSSRIEQATTEHKLTCEELELILADDSLNEALFAAADTVRKQYVGDEVHLRGLIEFSNICRQNCCYCGLRRDNRAVGRYRQTPDEIVHMAEQAVGYGYRTVVLQSGEDAWFNVDRMTDIIRRIKALGIAITLSLGEKPFADYQAYREAGADRYLLRIETTDRALYEKHDPGMSFDARLRCLQDLRTLGFEVGTGCLVGLPGQSLASLAADILFFQQIDADMVGIGPFIPNPDTPLRDAAGGWFVLSRKVMALTRLLLPDSNIPATTAMETLHPQGRLLALQSGANVVMPNVTEGDYRRLYALYPGKICINDTPGHCRGCITGKIQSIGRRVSDTQGFRQRASFSG